MLRCVALCCIVLCRVVLYCIVLVCVVLCCIYIICLVKRFSVPYRAIYFTSQVVFCGPLGGHKIWFSCPIFKQQYQGTRAITFIRI